MGLGILAVCIGIATVGSLLYGVDPNRSVLRSAFEGPSVSHPLGTDDLGRDLLARVMAGTRLSLVAATQAVTLAIVIGVPLGLMAGFIGGTTDQIIMRVTDALMSFPGLILAIAIVGFLGPGLRNAMIAIGIVYSPWFTRVIRGSTMSVAEEAYIDAARISGATTSRILSRHILPNVASPLVVQATIGMALAILAEAALSFLGLGVQPPAASLGAILRRSFRYMSLNPWPVVAPGVVIMLLVWAFNLVGDALRDTIGIGAQRRY